MSQRHSGLTLDRVNGRIRRKPCHSIILSINNPRWTDPSVNPGLRGDRTNRLSYGTAEQTQKPLTVCDICTRFQQTTLLRCLTNHVTVQKTLFRSLVRGFSLSTPTKLSCKSDENKIIRKNVKIINKKQGILAV